MRFLISICLIVGATALACHGIFNEDAAWEAYKALEAGPAAAVAAGSPHSRAELVETWPYTTAASRARADILAGWEKEQPSAEEAGYFTRAWDEVRERGFAESLPFAFPFGAAAVALGALLLCILMPRTRFRDFSILFLVLGAVACWPAFAAPAQQVTYVDWFDPLRHVVAWFPQIAVSLLFIAGLLMVGVRRPRPQAG